MVALPRASTWWSAPGRAVDREGDADTAQSQQSDSGERIRIAAWNVLAVCITSAGLAAEGANCATMPLKQRAQELLHLLRVGLGRGLEERTAATKLPKAHVVKLDPCATEVCEQLPVTIACCQRRAAVPARRRSATAAPQQRFLADGGVVALAVPNVRNILAAEKRALWDGGPRDAHDCRQPVHCRNERVVDATLWDAGAADDERYPMAAFV
mmetsp:Transcript_20699/g.53800  ORF Transcript_20699/g.53800 Transcript_20699/m.53800 type:complete len:212 (+) Transcript_20699:285-920(+)